MNSRSELTKLLMRLSKHLPTLLPIKMIVTKVPVEVNGDCLLMNGYFRIRVSEKLSNSMKEHILVHEYAHALAWIKDGAEDYCEDPHGPFWGIQYARVWRWYSDTFCSQVSPVLDQFSPVNCGCGKATDGCVKERKRKGSSRRRRTAKHKDSTKSGLSA